MKELNWIDESYLLDHRLSKIYFKISFYTNPPITAYLKKEDIDNPSNHLWRVSFGYEYKGFNAVDDIEAKEIAVKILIEVFYKSLGCLIDCS